MIIYRFLDAVDEADFIASLNADANQVGETVFKN